MEVQKNNMKNIFRVFANDWKRIGRNVVALVVVMGLSVLPSLYAWFNILSNWDPYGSDSTSNIKVAVAYDDTGIDISGMNVNISTNIIEALKTNDTIGWVFTDTSEEAIEGVWAGDYYAALIMPEDFSRDMVSFLADNMTHPEIIYYTNQKKNAIAHSGFQAVPQGHQWHGRFHGKWWHKGRSKNGPSRQRQYSHKCYCPDSMHRLDGQPLQP